MLKAEFETGSATSAAEIRHPETPFDDGIKVGVARIRPCVGRPYANYFTREIVISSRCCGAARALRKSGSVAAAPVFQQPLSIFSCGYTTLQF
jgi:hypothetical protein